MRGKLAENVIHFARVLRRAGLPVGPDRVIDAMRALEIVGLDRRDDFQEALAAVFLDRHEQRDLFDQAFHVFWRDPDLLSRVMKLLLPQVASRGARRNEPLAPRLAASLAPPALPQHADRIGQRMDADWTLTWSNRERLQHQDFEKMTLEELAQAKAVLAQFRLWLPAAPTRRYRSTPLGRRIDMRASLRAALRSPAAVIPLKRRSRTKREVPLVVLCDVSGSMQRYTRMLLHFVHAISNDGHRIDTFTFGTRLTSITRYLKHRDVDAALAAASGAVRDWSGGTRIGACLAEFNRDWSRRLLGHGAHVLIVSDGLDRDDAIGLAHEMERLRASCRRLIWLNPLLRFAGFEARAAGIAAMLPHVDAFLPAHNLQSLAQLAASMRTTSPKGALARGPRRESVPAGPLRPSGR
jgi:uncharacterized protein with von Willebrand factor type A (vWA) domain